jgi:tripartite-type tricarboxylate transporter receptor subunit TctC
MNSSLPGLFALRSLALCATLAAALGASLSPAAAQAQSGYPNKPVRVIVPFPPGGPSDFVARMLTDRLGAALGGTVIVEHKPGAGTAIGTDATAKAAPDGYTMLVVAAMSTVSLPYLQKALPYTLDDLMLLNRFAATPFVLAVNAAVPARDVKELIAYAKANPNKLNYGTSGVGQSYHLAAELFRMRTGTEFNHVPYKGSAPALTDLLNGSIQMIFDVPLTPLPHVASGKLRVLGTTGAARLAQLPDTPTFREQGLTDYNPELWWGVFGPRGIPREIATRLHAEIARVAALSEVKEQLGKRAIQTAGCASLEACASLLRAESELVGGIIRRIGLKPE